MNKIKKLFAMFLYVVNMGNVYATGSEESAEVGSVVSEEEKTKAIKELLQEIYRFVSETKLDKCKDKVKSKHDIEVIKQLTKIGVYCRKFMYSNIKQYSDLVDEFNELIKNQDTSPLLKYKLKPINTNSIDLSSNLPNRDRDNGHLIYRYNYQYNKNIIQYILSDIDSIEELISSTIKKLEEINRNINNKAENFNLCSRPSSLLPNSYRSNYMILYIFDISKIDAAFDMYFVNHNSTDAHRFNESMQNLQESLLVLQAKVSDELLLWNEASIDEIAHEKEMLTNIYSALIGYLNGTITIIEQNAQFANVDS